MVTTILSNVRSKVRNNHKEAETTSRARQIDREVIPLLLKLPTQVLFWGLGEVSSFGGPVDALQAAPSTSQLFQRDETSTMGYCPLLMELEMHSSTRNCEYAKIS